MKVEFVTLQFQINEGKIIKNTTLSYKSSIYLDKKKEIIYIYIYIYIQRTNHLTLKGV